jgi:hypothetical protein
MVGPVCTPGLLGKIGERDKKEKGGSKKENFEAKIVSSQGCRFIRC